MIERALMQSGRVEPETSSVLNFVLDKRARVFLIDLCKKGKSSY